MDGNGNGGKWNNGNETKYCHGNVWELDNFMGMGGIGNSKSHSSTPLVPS